MLRESLIALLVSAPQLQVGRNARHNGGPFNFVSAPVESYKTTWLRSPHKRHYLSA